MVGAWEAGGQSLGKTSVFALRTSDFGLRTCSVSVYSDSREWRNDKCAFQFSAVEMGPDVKAESET